MKASRLFSLVAFLALAGISAPALAMQEVCLINQSSKDVSFFASGDALESDNNTISLPARVGDANQCWRVGVSLIGIQFNMSVSLGDGQFEQFQFTTP